MIEKGELSNKEKGGGELKNNSCSNCREGLIMKNDVYCNIFGRFNPQCENYKCIDFIPKKRERQIAI